MRDDIRNGTRGKKPRVRVGGGGGIRLFRHQIFCQRRRRRRLDRTRITKCITHDHGQTEGQYIISNATVVFVSCPTDRDHKGIYRSNNDRVTSCPYVDLSPHYTFPWSMDPSNLRVQEDAGVHAQCVACPFLLQRSRKILCVDVFA